LPGASVLSGTECPDRFLGDNNALRIQGRAGSDRLIGSRAADILLGDQGDDMIFGMEGKDILEGGAGDDSLFGGIGDDILNGGSGHDVLVGGPGNDLLSGGRGQDLYVFSQEDGVDVIEEIAEEGNMVFFPRLDLTDVKLSLDKNNYYIDVTEGGSIHIKAPLGLSPFQAALFPRYRSNILIIRIDGVSYVILIVVIPKHTTHKPFFV